MISLSTAKSTGKLKRSPVSSQFALEYRYFSGSMALGMIVSKRGEMDEDFWDGDGSNDRGGAMG
jgi:hypothetical protein